MEGVERVVVTGGAGFIGSHVVEHYALKGAEVKVIDNLSRRELLIQNGLDSRLNVDFINALPAVRLLKLDVRDFDAIAPYIQEADVVIHAAGQTAVTTSIANPIVDFSINTLGTVNVLEAARKATRPPIIIICSTNKVYGKRVNDLGIHINEKPYQFEPQYANGIPETFGIDLCEHTPYGCSKLSADLYAQDYANIYGLKVGIFRMSCIYGTRQFGVEDQGWLAWFIIATLLGKPITIYGDGKQVRDVLYVSDLVQAFDRFVSSDLPYGVFNIGGGPENTLSLLELLDLIETETGLRPEIRFADWRPSDQRVYISDIRKAQKLLEWSPTVSPENGVAHMVTWVRENMRLLTQELAD